MRIQGLRDVIIECLSPEKLSKNKKLEKILNENTLSTTKTFIPRK